MDNCLTFQQITTDLAIIWITVFCLGAIVGSVAALQLQARGKRDEKETKEK